MTTGGSTTSLVRRTIGSLRARIGALRYSLDQRRVVTISGGPARGMRIGLRLASNEYRAGAAEPSVQSALTDALGPGDVFFDIGANIGYFSLVAAAAVGADGELHAFEARPDVADALRLNMRRNELDATIWAVAVGDHTGTATLLMGEHPGGATIDEPSAPDVVDEVSVGQVTIDDLVESGRTPIPNVVKIDVEGAELSVFRGMEATMREHHPIVVFEIDDAERDSAEERYASVVSMLVDRGYECTRLDENYADIGWAVIHGIARPAVGAGTA